MINFIVRIGLISFVVCCGVVGFGTFRAEASPLCVQVTGQPSRCIYVDPSQCRIEAARQGGLCAANPAEFPITVSGSAPFCVVESNLAMSCVYPDRRSCSEESVGRHGACVTALPRPHPSVDPYEEKRPY
jgi:hypothetical protein